MSGKMFNTPEVVAKARELLDSSTDVPNLKERAQCIYWNAEKGMDLEEIAKLLDVSVRTVKRWRKEFYYYVTQNIAKWENWGGRRTMNLSLETEKEILQKCEDRANKGEIVTRKIIQEEYENCLGRKVVSAIVYQMLLRHDWRKVVAREIHPKADVTAQEEWKKKPLRASSTRVQYWMPPKKAT